MTQAGYIAYALALGLAAAIPGPGVVALVARALASAFWAGMAFATGLILGDLTYLAAAVFGLTRIAETLGDVFVLVRICAGLYLGSLAIQLWRASAPGSRAEDRTSDRPLGSFVAGLTVTLANPKTIVFYLAVLPTLLDLRVVTDAGRVRRTRRHHRAGPGRSYDALRGAGLAGAVCLPVVGLPPPAESQRRRHHGGCGFVDPRAAGVTVRLTPPGVRRPGARCRIPKGRHRRATRSRGCGTRQRRDRAGSARRGRLRATGARAGPRCPHR